MDKEQKELEIKKLKIEKLKALEGIIRTVVIAILTIGAGIGTLIFQILVEKEKTHILLYKYLIVLLSTIEIVLIVLLIFLLRKFNEYWRS